MVAMCHVQTSYIHAVVSQGLQRFIRTRCRSDGAHHLCFPSTPEAFKQETGTICHNSTISTRCVVVLCCEALGMQSTPLSRGFTIFM